MKFVITGAAGFIGFHLASKLIGPSNSVIAIDNLNSYYDKNLKLSRLRLLYDSSKQKDSSFVFYENNLEDYQSIEKIFDETNPDIVVNLAAQAGVRYSIDNPSAYIQSNLVGFANILECCRRFNVQQLIYASSSSVYGGNTDMPFKETQSVDHPISLYASTKKANELMAHSYSHLYNIPTTGLRFFTVYGPWGRPDMALFKFTKNILENRPIDVYNNGQMVRDFTYIDDVVESIFRLLYKPASADPEFQTSNPNSGSSWAPYRIFNIGNSKPIPLLKYISCLEESLQKKSVMNFLPMQDGDVPATASDTSQICEWINFSPNTPIQEGINKFVSWYKSYYNY